MPECERCGENYRSGSDGSTRDHCGTCIFINGDPPTDKVIPTTTYVDRVPRQYRPTLEEESV